MDILEKDTCYPPTFAADAKSRLLKLLPFLASCGLYFALWLPEPSWVSTSVKSLPVLSLVWFLTAQAWGDGAWTPAARWICWGLIALLAAMAWRALARPPPHLAVATGSLLFMASDLVLAWDHFCAPVPHARLMVMGSYYAAQGLIAAWAPRASPRWKET
ncbi:hypothetical protein KIL84_001600 [Mauremys mutica]|uniref:lysoplasmalogenase n=1 Tax=Mauremys mutica TaxID=74926 RepID=A0A9D3XJF6_9SAUR|nr:hypothetical protein KIL84_001600 [Mauremys mutica]